MLLKIKGKKILKGEIAVPGDKSISHRAIILSSLSQSKIKIENILFSEDIYRTIEAFKTMGIPIEVNKKEKYLIVEGKGLYGLEKPDKPIDCGNSGTTMRLLSGVLAAQDFESELIGDKSLSKRPMDRVVKPLREMGANISSENGTAPIKIKPAKLNSIKYKMPVDSAQVKSAILLASLYTKGKSKIIEKNISRDHTELMLKYFIENDFKPTKIFIPGDVSSASFFIVSSLITKGSSICIKDISINPTRTGFIDVLLDMNANIKIKNKRINNNELIGDIYVKHSKLKAMNIDNKIMGRLIDEVPILAVAASFAEGISKVKGAEELRLKETDRIKSIVKGLRSFGVDIYERKDGFIINGNSKKEFTTAKVNSYNDHRIAMALSVLALNIKGESQILQSDCVEFSFPGFYDQLLTNNRF